MQLTTVLGTWEYGIIHVIWQQVNLFDTIRKERYYLSTFSCMSFLDAEDYRLM